MFKDLIILANFSQISQSESSLEELTILSNFSLYRTDLFFHGTFISTATKWDVLWWWTRILCRQANKRIFVQLESSSLQGISNCFWRNPGTRYARGKKPIILQPWGGSSSCAVCQRLEGYQRNQSAYLRDWCHFTLQKTGMNNL